MKRTIAFLLAAITLLALTSCQAAPDEVFAVKNDTERMAEQAADNSAGTKVSMLKVPDGNYKYQASAADGKLTINADAPVTVPESGKIPTVKVSETGFTQEQVTGFFNYLFPDEQPVSGANVPGVLTKDEIKELIAMYKKYIAEGTVEKNTLYTEEEMEEEIKSLEKQYESAPVTEPIPSTQISDGTMTTETTGGDKYAGEEILSLDVRTKDNGITVCVPVHENGHWENYLIFAWDEPVQFSEMNAMRVDVTNWQAATKGKLTISYEDAKKLCDGFFEAGNITDVALSDVFVIDDERTDHGDGRSNKAGNYAYQFHYVRTAGGSPVANMSYLCSEDDNSLPWMYERITFWVNNNGIIYIDWTSYTTAGEIISDDTKVISFEEAREIFETMIVTRYGAGEGWLSELKNVNVEINGIALSLVRVREQNAPGRNGIYTPAWVFYGNVKKEYEFGGNNIVQYGWSTVSEYPFTKYPVLIINAVDGSIIDPEKGY